MNRLLLSLLSLLAITGSTAILWNLQASSDPRPPAERLDDLASDPLPLLRSLPCVAHVQRAGSLTPTARIVHILNWHLIPEDLHAIDGGLNGQTYAEHLDEVEAVQSGLLPLLRALAGQQSVETVLVEGLTAEGLEAWQARLDGFTEASGQQADLRRITSLTGPVS
jgi:hypothetical protein